MFKKILKSNQITQKQLSKILNCGQPLISKWCRGICEPSLNSIIKISRSFNIPIEEIVLSFEKGADNGRT